MNAAFGLALFIIVAVLLYWFDQGRDRFDEWFRDIEGVIAHRFGYTVVDHFVEWGGWEFREREVFSKGTKDDVIQQHNVRFAEKFIKDHKLENKPGLTHRWTKL